MKREADTADIRGLVAEILTYWCVYKKDAGIDVSLIA